MGVTTEDLLEIYCLFIRSRAEYLSVVWHSSLTVEQTKKIENIQKTCLKIILGDNYIDYPATLEMCAFEELSVRRQQRCLSFAKKCLRTPLTEGMSPENPLNDYDIRQGEKYKVNFAHTVNYRQSAVPFCQRLLNEDTRAREVAATARAVEARARTAGAAGQRYAGG